MAMYVVARRVGPRDFRFGDVIAAMLASVAALAVAAASLLVDAGHVTELSVAEEQPIGTLVGSVRESPDVTGEQVRFNWRFSSGFYELFAIDSVSGDIQTAQRVDREQLCASDQRSTSSNSRCSLELDVTVMPIKFYRILKVRALPATSSFRLLTKYWSCLRACMLFWLISLRFCYIAFSAGVVTCLERGADSVLILLKKTTPV